MTPQELLDKTLTIMKRHVYQIEADATHVTKDGKLKGFTATDAQVLEKYAKVFMVLTKDYKQGDDIDELSDEELLQRLSETDNDNTETDAD